MSLFVIERRGKRRECRQRRRTVHPLWLFVCLVAVRHVMAEESSWEAASTAKEPEDDETMIDLDTDPVKEEPEEPRSSSLDQPAARDVPTASLPVNNHHHKATPSSSSSSTPEPTLSSDSSEKRAKEDETGSFAEGAYPTESLDFTSIADQTKEDILDAIIIDPAAEDTVDEAQAEETQAETIEKDDTANDTTSVDDTNGNNTTFAEGANPPSRIETAHDGAATDDAETRGQTDETHQHTSEAEQSNEREHASGETEQAPQKKQGSLASFMEKVNKKTDAGGGLTETLESASRVYTAEAKRQGIWVENKEKSYRGIWGELKPNEQRPNVSILFDLFQEAFVEAVTGATKEEANTLANEMGDLLESKTAAVDESLWTDNRGQGRNDFVDGLDDLDKLFEDVEAPEELEIGILQEILVGRTSHIVRKRLMMGVSFLKATFARTRQTISEHMVEKRIRIPTKEEFMRAGEASWRGMQRVYQMMANLLRDLFEDGTDDDETLSDAYLEEEIRRAVP